MLKKLFCAVMAAAVVAGCSGEKEHVDPYAEVTLAQATRGPAVISKGFKYKLRNPQIVETEGHLAIIKEGNYYEMLAGRSIADKLESMDKSNIEFNVVKKYSPFVHFKVEQIVSGTDTVFISAAGAINYPRVVEKGKYKARDHDNYELDRLQYNRTAQLRQAVDKKFKVTGKVSLVEDEDGNMDWMLTGGSSTVRISEPDDAIVMVLRQLAANNTEFEGGITFTEVEPWPERKDNQICGTVTVDFVSYLGKVVEG